MQLLYGSVTYEALDNKLNLDQELKTPLPSKNAGKPNLKLAKGMSQNISSYLPCGNPRPFYIHLRTLVTKILGWRKGIY